MDLCFRDYRVVCAFAKILPFLRLSRSGNLSTNCKNDRLVALSVAEKLDLRVLSSLSAGPGAFPMPPTRSRSAIAKGRRVSAVVPFFGVACTAVESKGADLTSLVL